MDFHTIQSALLDLAKTHEVQTLWACESGSRAWGFASPDSDYDGRFLFMHSRSTYTSPWDPPDEIRAALPDDLDFAGWELRKALRLAYKSNAPLLEWLQSPIIYAQAPQFHAEFLELARAAYSPKECARIYLGTARTASEDFLPDGRIKIKKLFYILRPLLAARWVLQAGTLMPMTFAALCAPLQDEPRQRDFLEAIRELEVRKSQAVEGELHAPTEVLRQSIDQLFLSCREAYESLPDAPIPDRAPFIDFFQRALATWG